MTNRINALVAEEVAHNRIYDFETRAIHTGTQYREETGAVTPPIFATSTFESGNVAGFDYTRSGNPNFRNLEETLASLEEGKYATVFSSGVAAITSIISTLKSGDVVLCEENLYGCTYRLFEQVFSKFGILAHYIDFTDPDALLMVDKLKPALVWIESPTNPLLKVIDIAKVASRCGEFDSTLVVDNTFASSFFQKPLRLGAMLSLSSTTKYLNGHSDCLGGVVVTNSKVWNERLIFSQKALGLNPSPFDSWLTSRGVKTLSLRMKQHASNAFYLASWLEESKKTKRVLYPFLPSHPQYELAKSQMLGGSGIVTVDLGLSLDRTRTFLNSLELFTLAESLGGVESLVCHPASMTHASIPKALRERIGISDSLVRFSVGVEAIDDLISDIDRAHGLVI